MAFLIAATAAVGAVSAQLSLQGAKCGQITCSLNEYCSPETNRCAPCRIVCDNTTHNYDYGLCIKECVGYLLDLRYMRKEDSMPFVDYSSAQREAKAALIISGVALAILAIVLVIVCQGRFTWKYIKQKFQPNKNRVKQYPAHGLTHQNPHAELSKKPELKLDIPEGAKRQPQPLNARDLEARTSQTEKSQGATTPKTMSTVLSNRYPAEDTTLDFSYDNMAMNVTPPEQPAASHKF